MGIIEQLTEIGLEKREADIYLQLLKLKNQTATRISRETKINRTVVYSILEKLIQKGLATYVLINGKKHFSANNPKSLKDFLEDKQSIVSQLLPKLNALGETKRDIVSVEVFQGIKGGIAVLKDIIREGKDYVSFGDEGSFENLGTHADQYIRKINEKNIRERILTKEGIKFRKKGKKSEIRFLSKEFEFPTITTIYGDKIAIAIFEEPFYTILIKSKTLAKTYKSIFEGLWKLSKSK